MDNPKSFSANPESKIQSPRFQDVLAAAERLQGKVRRTPVHQSRTFSSLTGCDVFLKLENLQRTGSFKIRGALNRILTLTPEQQRRGVVAASSGNHAQGVALAAATVGVPATIVMPVGAPIAKVVATRGYGAQIILHGQLFDEAHAHALDLATEHGQTYIHPFDDWVVMAGQGTIAPEMLADVPDLDVIVVPIGGGGLISGIALAAKALRPALRVVGVQPEGSDASYRAIRGTLEGPLQHATSIADALVVKQPGTHTLPIIRQHVDDIALVSEESICEAMVLLMEREKLVAEGAGALGVAALLSGRVQAPARRVGVLVSGGNVDLTVMDRVIQYGLTSAGRHLLPGYGRGGPTGAALSTDPASV